MMIIFGLEVSEISDSSPPIPTPPKCISLSASSALSVSSVIAFHVFDKMTPPTANENIFHALFAQGLIVQVVDMQMFFASAQNALAIVMREKFLPFDLPCFGSDIAVVIERRRDAGQLDAHAFGVEFANPLRTRCGLQNFCACLFVHNTMIKKNPEYATKMEIFRQSARGNVILSHKPL